MVAVIGFGIFLVGEVVDGFRGLGLDVVFFWFVIY